VLDFRVISIK